MSFLPTNRDRILVVAPHPDDESLATGGLILKALQAGAAVRVLFATNGDNNPWPQRWVEKRWRIGGGERSRWGAARRQEAIAAIEALGLPADAGRFLNFPDQGMSGKLLRAEAEAVGILGAELADFSPTLLVLPSPHDLHPDHNALYVLFQAALEQTGMQADVRQLQFLVHCRRPDLVPGRIELALSEEERLQKRRAILCHKTQMVLSRKRFVAYARPVEAYYQPLPAAETFQGHRVRQAFVERGALTLAITLSKRRWEGTSLFVALESPSGGSRRWRLPMPLVSRAVPLRDTAGGAPARKASVRIKGRVAWVRIPVAAFLPLSRVFVKLHKRTLFLDDAGWREVPLPDSVPRTVVTEAADLPETDSLWAITPPVETGT